MAKILTMQENQQVSLEILKRFAKICEEQGFRYYLMFGTLIGAVRHKGFIPWDDDLDVMMPRKDYDAFIEYFLNNKEECSGLELFTPDTCKDYPYMISRLSDNRYYIDTENEKDYGLGSFIDIYPFDGLGTEWKSALKYGLKGDRLSSLCFQATRQKYVTTNTSSLVRKIGRLPVFIVAKIMGKEFFMNKLRKLVGLIDYETSKYVCCVVWLTNGAKEIYEREWFDDYTMLTFEGNEFRVPKEYDKVLRNTYGDYMQLPPEKDQTPHHYYTVYKKD